MFTTEAAVLWCKVAFLEIASFFHVYSEVSVYRAPQEPYTLEKYAKCSKIKDEKTHVFLKDPEGR